MTATLKGIIDHTDSCGNAGRYGQGDLQWMTAGTFSKSSSSDQMLFLHVHVYFTGKGVVHGEMFPLINADKPNPTKFFQIWLNLPKKSKMVAPAFAMVSFRVSFS